MFIPDKLKLNKFRSVSIPSPADYVQRFGLHSSTPSYSGNYDAPMPQRKLDILHNVGNSDSYNLYNENRSETPEPTPEPTPESTE